MKAGEPPINARWPNEPKPGRWFYVYAKFRLESTSIRVVLPFKSSQSL
jgi:hypothetical protein